MSTVTSIDPESFVEQSIARFFQIFLITDRYALSWANNGFHNIEINGFATMQIYRKQNLIQQYYNAPTWPGLKCQKFTRDN
jgi:hypothetical protein